MRLFDHVSRAIDRSTTNTAYHHSRILEVPKSHGTHTGRPAAVAQHLANRVHDIPVLPSGTSIARSLCAMQLQNHSSRSIQVTSLQWVLDWYPMGKTSDTSRFNVPGKWGWAIAESTGFTTLLYIMYTLPEQQGIKTLPWGNWTMAGCFVRLPRDSASARANHPPHRSSTTSTAPCSPRSSSTQACPP